MGKYHVQRTCLGRVSRSKVKKATGEAGKKNEAFARPILLRDTLSKQVSLLAGYADKERFFSFRKQFLFEVRRLVLKGHFSPYDEEIHL